MISPNMFNLFIQPSILFVGMDGSTPEQAEAFWLWHFFGRLHPLMVHFAVALLVVAGLMELTTLRRYQSKLRPGINLLVYAGASGALLSVLFGWLLADLESYGGETLAWHRWSGVATAVLGLLAAGLLWAMRKKRLPSMIRLYRATLFLAAGGVSMAGHFGASITHGEDYLTSVTPWAADSMAETSGSSTASVSLASFPDSLSHEDQARLNVGVRTILAHNCYKCHSSDKTEGGLRFDDRELALKGGDSGPAIVPGNLPGSELYRRITLPAGHKEAMPGKGKPLAKDDIDLIAFWIEQGAPWPEGSAVSVFPVAALEPRLPALPSPKNGLTNPVDRLVNAYFEENGVKWADPIDDRTYLRRIYLDIVGLLPSPEELQAFATDTSPDKRAAMAEQLLNRNDDYATHWLTFWNDLLRNDYTGTGYITGGRYSISDWLYRSLAANTPYKQFVMELLNPNEASMGFIQGIQWRGVVNSSQSVPMQAAQNVSQAILGLNLKCASCHDSFVSDWKLEDAYAFANVFSEESLEINRCDVPTGEYADTRLLWNKLGEISRNASKKEKAEQLAVNLTRNENGRLYRTLVNRIWAQLMGRGIVAPVDEMDNAPWSQDLLDWLAYDFVENDYNIKKLIYLITTSRTYQLPAVSVDDVGKINAQDYQFTGVLRKKMTAEQFSDAVSSTIFPIYNHSQLKYNPYSQLDLSKIQIPFVRAALVQNDNFLAALGRPSRENVTSSRENQSNLLQAMELTNGETLNETLKNGARRWLQEHGDAKDLVRNLYLHTLNRAPSDQEYSLAAKSLGKNPKEESVQDLLWAVVLSPEFQLIN